MPPVARPLQEIAPEEIDVRENIVIGKAGSRELTGNLFLPRPGGATRPAIVMLHGGGWRKGSPRGVRGYGELLSRMGFVCLCPGYRLSSEAHWPAQLEDVKCAVRFLKAMSNEFGLDPERIGVMGDSSGGHLALMCGLDTPWEGSGGYADYSSTVRAVGATYAPVRVPHLRTDGERVGLMASDASDADYDSASPICYDLGSFPPCILIHGTEDKGVPVSGTIEFHVKLAESDRVVDLHLFAGEGHAFDRRKPGQEKMVDIADPSSIYGLTVVRLVGHFFTRYL